MAGDEPWCEKALPSGYTVDGTFQQYAIGKAAHITKISRRALLDAIAPTLCRNHSLYPMISHYSYNTNSSRFIKPLNNLTSWQVKL